ncbi:hypothetical protein IAT38_001706 [Cryptococcus sp. DSM 104549]
MIPSAYSSAAAFALAATCAWAKSQVCSPTDCLDGSSSSPLLAVDSSASVFLLPGTYDSSTYAPTSLNATISTTSSSLTISPPSHPVGFTKSNYAGSAGVWDGLSWAMQGWKSVYLPDGWYAVLDGGGGKVLWGAVPETQFLADDIASRAILSAGSSACTPACSSHGTCTPTNTSASCECAEGWTGLTCDECASGFFGTSCAACPANCTVCDDGRYGTGKCLGTSTSSSDECGCDHGTCSSPTDCTCSAGWVTNTTNSSSKCNACADGFFKDAFGNCLACPLGCKSCELQANTNATAACLSCSASLSLSTANPATCVASSGSCQSGTYYDSSSSSCQSCSPACSTCTGPSTSECLSCASPRVNLHGSCVGYDASTGRCDSSLSGLDGVFVVNNQKSKCDSCPVGCLSCKIPSFSTAASYDTLSCDACQEGYLLQGGKCVQKCGDGWFLPEGSAATNGTCQQCDSACGTCVGTSTTCTSCTSSSLSAFSGTCLPSSSCPSSTISLNGTCLPCLTDCASCSSPSTCSSCPVTRPVLVGGRCTPYCAKNTYWDTAAGSCQACDWTCKSCTGAGDGQCSACRDGYSLKSGVCVALSCSKSGGVAPTLGICLSSLVDTSKKAYLWLLALIGVAALVALGGWWYVRKQRRATREGTQEFKDRLDERGVQERLRVLRLEKVFGLERVSTGRGGDRSTAAPSGENEFDDGKKRRFRELLLPSRRKHSSSAGLELKDASNFAPDRAARGGGDGWVRESWVAPPPYVPSSAGGSPREVDSKAVYPLLPLPATAPVKHPRTHANGSRDSLDSIPTPTLAGFSFSSRPAPQRKSTSSSLGGSTVVLSMGSPTSPEAKPRAGGLMPPPRPGMARRGSGDSDAGSGVGAGVVVNAEMMGRERETIRLNARDEGGEMDVERRLRELWPALKEREGAREGYI